MKSTFTRTLKTVQLSALALTLVFPLALALVTPVFITGLHADVIPRYAQQRPFDTGSQRRSE